MAGRTSISVSVVCICIWGVLCRTGTGTVQIRKEASLETIHFIDGDFNFVFCWIFNRRMEHAGNGISIFFLCNAGSDIPKSQRTFLCEYDVYRKSQKWYSSLICIFKRKEAGAVRNVTILFRCDPVLCGRSRNRRCFVGTSGLPCYLGIQRIASYQFPSDV